MCRSTEILRFANPFLHAQVKSMMCIDCDDTVNAGMTSAVRRVT
jgi:hypothetical protein